LSGADSLTIGALTLADLAPLFEDPPETSRARLEWPHSPFAFWLARARPTWRIAGTGAAFDDVCALINAANVSYELVTPASPAANLLVLEGASDDDAMGDDELTGFDRWQPFLAPDAVVLIHGIHAGFGGAALWRQWRHDHPASPALTLSAGQGLGLGIMDATAAPPPMVGLCALPADAVSLFERICRSAAARWAAASREAENERRAAWQARAYVRAAERQREALQSAVAEITAERARLSAEREQVQADLSAESAKAQAELSAERAKAQAELSAERAGLNAEHARAEALAQRIAAMEASNTWRAGMALQRIPAPVRTILRRVAQVIWWIVTGQLIRRLRARRASIRAAADVGSGRWT